MLALLLSSVAASTLPVAGPVAPGKPGPHHGFATAAYWRCRFFGARSDTHFAVGELQFRGSVGGADLATGGTPIGTPGLSGNELANAFDDDTGTNYWRVDRAEGVWVGYQFPTPVTVKEVALTARFSSHLESPNITAVECSDDGITWSLVDVFHEPLTWLSGQTSEYTLGTGYIHTEVARNGVTSSYGSSEVRGQSYTATHDFWITEVKPYMTASRVLQATIALINPSTHAITEILTTSEPGPDGSTVGIPITPVQITSGQTFAILLQAASTEVEKGVPLRTVANDLHAVVAAPHANWIQTTPNITVSATPDVTVDTGHGQIFFGAVFRNGFGSSNASAFALPAFVPFPTLWLSPDAVTEDGSGVTTITNLGIAGSSGDAAPATAAHATIAQYAFWGNRNTFAIPNTSTGGYNLAGDVAVRSLMTTTTFGTEEAPESDFPDQAAIISGPVGNNTEFEISGDQNDAFLYSGRADFLSVNGSYYADDERRPVLPFHKANVGGVENSITGTPLVGTLWYNNASTGRNWYGTMGEILGFRQVLSEYQLFGLHEALTEFYEPLPEVTPLEAALTVILGSTTGADSLSAQRSKASIIIGGTPTGISSRTSAAYVIIQE